MNTRLITHTTLLRPTLPLLLAAISLLGCPLSTCFAQGSAFTYQGSLNLNGSAVTGTQDFEFRLFNAVTGGAQQGAVITVSDLGVTNGLFTAALDFGAAAFPGADRWLEIATRPGTNTGAYITLSPRQPITSTPYALRAANLTGTLPLSQLPPGVVTNNATGLSLTGTFTGNGSGVSNVNAATLGGVSSAGFWRTNGNAGANPTNGAFLGTTDNQPLEFRANGVRGLRIEPTANGAPNFVSGSPSNFVAAGVSGATVQGGSTDGNINSVGGDYGTVSGGRANSTSAQHGTIGGGFANGMGISGTNGTISGGYLNNVIGAYGVVPGGAENMAGGNYAFAAGRRARATFNGSFVWADSIGVFFTATDTNQFLIRAGGGVGINTNNPNGAALAVHGNVAVNGNITGNGAGLTGLNAAALTGTIPSGAIGAASITTGQLADRAVTSDKLAGVTEGVRWHTFTNPTPAAFEGMNTVSTLGNDRVLIGSPRDSASGSQAGTAYLFATNGALLATFNNPTPEPGDLFGQSLAAIGPDHVVVSAVQDNAGANRSGAVYVFGTNGNLVTTIPNPTPAEADFFGVAVAPLGRDRLLVGAFSDDNPVTNSGAAYLFNLNGTLLTTFVNPPALDDAFGYSVAALGTDRVLVGAPNGKVNGQYVGLVHVFNTNGAWLNTITNPVLAPFGNFGLSIVPVDEDRFLTAAVGSLSSGVGVAYLFRGNGTLLATFTNPVPQIGSHFGSRFVPLGGDRVLISAPSSGIVSTVTNFQAVYVFGMNGTLLGTITNPVPQNPDRFGVSLAALGNNQALVAVPYDDTGAQDAGAIYQFNLASYVPGLGADSVRAGGVTTASLANGAVTAEKIDPTIGLWIRSGDNVFRPSGNVGIGTAAPTTKLHVKSASADAEISLEGGDVGSRRWTLQSSAPGGDAQLNTSFQVIDRTANVRRLLLGTSGNAAIGGLANATGFSAIALGYNVAASGNYSTAIGNDSIASGGNSMALGSSARAAHDGSFVWADSIGQPFTSTANNQFSIRASRGLRLSDSTSMEFGSTARQMLNLWSTNYGIGVQASSLYFRCNNADPNDGFIWYKGGAHNDGYANAGGGTELMHLVQGGLYVNGALVPSSDRNKKENFKPVDPLAVLDKVAALPLSEWSYKADTGTRHVGPMAQDFYAAFGVGPDDKHIATVDADGVALAAIQGLNRKLEETRAENAALREELSEIKRLLRKLSTE